MMKHLSVFFLAAIIGTATFSNALAQNRTLGAESVVLDDGAGHTFTISAPTGLNAGNSPMSYNFPVAPVGAASGFVTAGTLGGQTLFWNSAAGHLDWEPSSIITNNTNGDGTNVTISAPLIVSGTITSTGAITGASFIGDGSALTNLAGGNITAGTITNTQISATAGITASQLSDGGATAGNVLTSVGGGAPTWQAPASSFAPAYYNAYTTTSQLMLPFDPVFGMIVAQNSGITSSFTGFFVNSTGTYKVDYAVSPDISSAFALRVNGVVAPNSHYGCATGNTVINGSAILALNAGDLVELINSSPGPIFLNPVYPGTVTASLTAVRLQ